jgi:hypothetical protein
MRVAEPMRSRRLAIAAAAVLALVVAGAATWFAGCISARLAMAVWMTI